jgi:hypothetical protein
LQTSVDRYGEEDFSYDHPDAVRMMIDFMYLGDYEGTISGDTTNLYLGRS